MNIIEALDDRNLLGASIRDAESWKPWRALLAAAFGLPLDPYQAELFRQCTGRTVPPAAPSAYLWLVIGRRGGKSFAKALIAVFLAVFRDWHKNLSPGERGIILLIAADREQAKILHRYCQGILRPPILQSLVLNVTASEIELKGGVTIEVVTRSYRTVRGRSVCVAVLDELAFWRDDDSGKSRQRSFERCPRVDGDVWRRRDGDCRLQPVCAARRPLGCVQALAWQGRRAKPCLAGCDADDEPDSFARIC